jgi:hypothetical protein
MRRREPGTVFQPTNETFETLPIESEDWTALCNKVSTAIMERIIP